MEDRLIDTLVKTVGRAGVLNTPEDLAVYSYDGTFAEGQPDVVVLPETTQQVSEIVRLAAEARVPGAARDGLRAGCRIDPIWQNVVICSTHEPHPGNRHREMPQFWLKRVITADSNRLKDMGFYPRPFEHPPLTIGGNIACNAGGRAA
jgi:glycolate oxidase